MNNSDSCDNCNKECPHIEQCLYGIGEGIPFQRLRRITGYISGDYIRSFNDAKKKEVEDRIASNTYNNVEHYHKRNINDT